MFASAWPKLIKACDVGGVTALLQLATTAELCQRIPCILVTERQDRQTEGQTSQLGYILHFSPLQVADAKKSFV